MKSEIKHCPTCGSPEIRRVKRNWADEYKGEKYVVPGLEYEECPACGEQLFDRDAMLRMEEVCPAFKHVHRKAA